jgi:hypothetical protein
MTFRELEGLEATIIDPVVEPERANEAVRQITSPAANMPLMGTLPTDVALLPGGFIDDEGALHTECRIREITGADEEAMARELLSPTTNIPKVVDLILKRCVLEIGTHHATPQLLYKMLIGDRAALMLAIRILTFGNDWEVPDFPCKLCGQAFGTIVELNSITMKKLDDPRNQQIEVELRNGHIAELALLDGRAQLDCVGDGTRTGAEETTIAIDHCLRSIDGVPVPGNMAQKLSMADRRKIAQALSDGQPGPRMEEVGVTCTKCGRDADYSVSLIDIFR